MKVEKPIQISIFLATPSAKTVHGVTPLLETTKTLSPRPKIKSPRQRSNKVFTFGLKNSFSRALQDV